MLIESLKYSIFNLKKVISNNISVTFFFLCFSIIIDLTREQFLPSGGSAAIVFGLIDVLGTSVFYAIFLNSILGILKFSTLNFFTYFRVNILYSIFFLLGVMVFVLPGLYILTFFFFAPVIALEGEKSSNYFKESKELVKKSPWNVLMLSLLPLLLTAFDTWFWGLLGKEVVNEILLYSLVLITNLFAVVASIYLFIATVFLYRKLQE